jgi:uncharacterized membrane protein YphA (DoxX/SURF4 family)
MNTLLWILQIILCIKFISVAFTHAFRRDKEEMQAAIHKLGSPARPLLTLAALGMVLSAIGLVLPALSPALAWLVPWAAAWLALMLLVSIGLHVLSRKSPKIWVSLILFTLSALAAYGRWAIAPL